MKKFGMNWDPTYSCPKYYNFSTLEKFGTVFQTLDKCDSFASCHKTAFSSVYIDTRLRDMGLSRSPVVPCPEVKRYCSLILNTYIKQITMNKKLYFVLLLTLAIPRLALAQNPINIDEYKVIDQSRFIITYEAMMTDDSLKPTEHNYDRLVLMVGDSISRCYSNTMYRYDSAFTISERKGHDSYKNMSHFVGDSGGVWVPDVYKYYGSKRMTVMHRIDEARVPIYLYDEPLDLMDWKMSFGTKEIHGYPCFKAECDFRGRHWTAWFTMQIPVKDGPWKFCGLPGLILEMEESRGHYAFRCIGIENQQKPIIWYDGPRFEDYQRCTRADVMKQEEDYHADFIGYIRMVNPGIQIHIAKMDASGKYAGSEEAPKGYKKVLPYNPVELE